MRIRSHLLLLVAGALIPLLAYSAGLTAYSWWEQRNSVEVRLLERVRAMTIALDTELQASIRVLRVLGLSPAASPDDARTYIAPMRAVMGTQPLWSVLAAGDPEWKTSAAVDGAGEVASPAIDEAARARAVQSRRPALSRLVESGGRYYTEIVVPVIRDEQVAMLLMVAIDQKQWLGFMSQYPMGSRAIMTLLDQDGRIIARTLNNDRTVGQMGAAKLIGKSRATLESTFRNVTLEGEDMYGAHSRSVRWGWTVATGVPATAVEATLFESTLLLVGAAVLSVGLAVLLAFLYGRGIARPMVDLGNAAHSLAEGEEPPRVDAGAIHEVREVSLAFQRASLMLRERERAVVESLEREQRARQQAEQASQAKDEFLAMLGHELRNPLNAITGANAVMQQAAPASSAAARAREIIARQAVNLRQLVDDLLDVARVTSGKIALDRKPVDLAKVASRAAAVMSASGRLAGHVLDVSCTPTWVCGDETRLEQVVTNLLDNASKYTPAGGRIELRVGREGERAELEVRDTGMGITADLLPRVFDLFSQGERTLDRSQGGLGLGLALVRRLVELHAGRVSAASEGAGRGARFIVSLPLHPAPQDAASPQPAEDEGERKLKILIVEDNPDGRETLVMMLGMHGHDVHEAADGPAGVREALQWHPDAAIVDIGLPGFDGYEVARRIRAAAKGMAIRLVALTGYGQEEDRRQAMAAGFDSFLVKPADFKAIRSILASV